MRNVVSKNILSHKNKGHGATLMLTGEIHREELVREATVAALPHAQPQPANQRPAQQLSSSAGQGLYYSHGYHQMHGYHMYTHEPKNAKVD